MIVGHAGGFDANSSFSARACRGGNASEKTWEVVAKKRDAIRRDAS